MTNSYDLYVEKKKRKEEKKEQAVLQVSWSLDDIRSKINDKHIYRMKRIKRLLDEFNQCYEIISARYLRVK